MKSIMDSDKHFIKRLWDMNASIHSNCTEDVLPAFLNDNKFLHFSWGPVMFLMITTNSEHYALWYIADSGKFRKIPELRGEEAEEYEDIFGEERKEYLIKDYLTRCLSTVDSGYYSCGCQDATPIIIDILELYKADQITLEERNVFQGILEEA